MKPRAVPIAPTANSVGFSTSMTRILGERILHASIWVRLVRTNKAMLTVFGANGNARRSG